SNPSEIESRNGSLIENRESIRLISSIEKIGDFLAGLSEASQVRRLMINSLILSPSKDEFLTMLILLLVRITSSMLIFSLLINEDNSKSTNNSSTLIISTPFGSVI